MANWPADGQMNARELQGLGGERINYKHVLSNYNCIYMHLGRREEELEAQHFQVPKAFSTSRKIA